MNGYVDGQVLTTGAVRGSGRMVVDVVDEWGLDSFPASDPPANW